MILRFFLLASLILMMGCGGEEPESTIPTPALHFCDSRFGNLIIKAVPEDDCEAINDKIEKAVDLIEYQQIATREEALRWLKNVAVKVRAGNEPWDSPAGLVGGLFRAFDGQVGQQSIELTNEMACTAHEMLHMIELHTLHKVDHVGWSQNDAYGFLIREYREAIGATAYCGWPKG